MSTNDGRAQIFSPHVPVMERQHWPTAQTEMIRLLDECAKLGRENATLREERDMLERRARMAASSNADDWRWYQNAAKQAVRSLDDRRKRNLTPNVQAEGRAAVGPSQSSAELGAGE